jgi:Ca2+-binding EF-hand superfamily protein
MKSKITNRITYSALILFVGAGFSYAQQPQRQEGGKRPTIEQLFKEMDANKDNKLSKKEIKGPLQKDFDKIDLNKDGFITKEELKKAPRPERPRPDNKK